MTSMSCNGIERELYASRFRRDLNGIMKAINNPRRSLQRVLIKSRRTQQPLFVAISPAAYTIDIDYLKEHQSFLDETL